MKTLEDLKQYTDGLSSTDKAMPVLFVGHGSPMNAIEETEFSARWRKLGTELPRPRAILAVSAHWETQGTFVTAMEKPRTIHDFGGFPPELYAVQYPAPGDPALASETKQLFTKAAVELDTAWGLDHGSWSVIRRIYPDADVPVLQLSLDHFRPPEWHYELAKELAPLRKKGVLILGSGNLVHNLGLLDWQNPEASFAWADEAMEIFRKLITGGDHRALIDYPSLGKAIRLAIPTPEHFLPLLYILALQEKRDSLTFFNDRTVMGSVGMASLVLQAG